MIQIYPKLVSFLFFSFFGLSSGIHDVKKAVNNAFMKVAMVYARFGLRGKIIKHL